MPLPHAHLQARGREGLGKCTTVCNLLIVTSCTEQLPCAVCGGTCFALYSFPSFTFKHFTSTLQLCATLNVIFSFLLYKQPLHLQSTFALFPQDGWTAVLLAAYCGHKEVVQELCETFGADFLHRKKVRAMQTISGSEWLSELCMY